MMIHPLDQQSDDSNSFSTSLYSDLSSEPLLTSDNSQDSDEDDAKLDRISDILSSLIQEANEAVKQSDIKMSKPMGSIPMIRKLSSSSSSEQRQHQRRKVSRTAARPLSYPSSMKRSTTVPSSNTIYNQQQNYQVIPSHIQRLPSPSNYMVRSQQQETTQDVLMESYKRLDSSLAMIDSLSRDLAPPEMDRPEPADQNKSIRFISAMPFNRNQLNTIMTNNKKNSLSLDSRLSALLLLPLLHVPHALISIAFESISNHDYHAPNSSLSGIVMWAILYAITNLVVDKALISPISIHRTLPSDNKYETANKKTRNELKELPGTSVPSMRLTSTSTRTRRKSVNSKRFVSLRKRYSFHQKQFKPHNENTPYHLPMQQYPLASSVSTNHTLSTQRNLSRRYSI